MLWYGVRLCIRVGRETSKNRHLRCLDLDLESDSRIGENNTHVRSLEDRKKHESDSVIRSRSLNTDGDNTLFGLTWAEGPGL